MAASTRHGTVSRREPLWPLAAVVAALVLAGPARAAAQGEMPVLAGRAPQGSWAVLFVDVARLRAMPSMQELTMQPGLLPPEADVVRQAAIYVLPMDFPVPDTMAPRWGAIVTIDPAGRDLIESHLADLTQAQVAGVAAHQDGAAIMGLLDDSTLVYAGDRDVFATLVQACRDGREEGAGGELAALLDPYARDAILGGFKLPASLGEVLAPDRIREDVLWTAGLHGGAFGVSVADGLSVHAVVQTGSAADAAEMLAQAHQGLAEAWAQMAGNMGADPFATMMMQPVAAVLNGLEFGVDGADFRVDLDLTPEESETLLSLVVGTAAMGFGRLGPARTAAREATGKANLHNIGLGIHMWSMANDDKLPPDLEAVLVQGYLDDESVFVHPADPAPVQRDGLAYSYEYVGSLPGDPPPDLIIAYAREGIMPGERDVLFWDLAIDTVNELDIHDPAGDKRTSLAACHAWIEENWGKQLDDETRARLRAFYEVEG